MKIQYYFLVIAAVALTQNTLAQNKKLIRPVFTPEKQFELSTTLEKEYYAGKESMTNQLYRHNYQLTVLSKDTNQTTTIRATYKGIYFILGDKKKGTITGFDSQRPDSMVGAARDEDSRYTNDLYMQYNLALIDQSFTIYINQKGTIEKVTGVDSTSDYALTKIKGRDPEYIRGFRASIKASDENEDLKATLQRAFDYTTSRPVGIGDSWIRSCPTDLDPINVNYTLKAAGGDSLQVALAASTLNQKYKMTIKKTGTYTIDTQSGLLRNGSMREDIVTTAANPQQTRMTTREKYTLLVK